MAALHMKVEGTLDALCGQANSLVIDYSYMVSCVDCVRLLRLPKEVQVLNGSRQKNWQTRKKAQGLCVQCGIRPLASRNHCKMCQALHRIRINVYDSKVKPTKNPRTCKLCGEKGHLSMTCTFHYCVLCRAAHHLQCPSLMV